MKSLFEDAINEPNPGKGFWNYKKSFTSEKLHKIGDQAISRMNGGMEEKKVGKESGVDWVSWKGEGDN